MPVRDSSLTLPGVVTTFRVCLPRALALRQVLVAMLAEGALEETFEVPMRVGSSSSLPGLSSD